MRVLRWLLKPDLIPVIFCIYMFSASSALAFATNGVLGRVVFFEPMQLLSGADFVCIFFNKSSYVLSFGYFFSPIISWLSLIRG